MDYTFDTYTISCSNGMEFMGRMVFVNERLEKIMTDLQRWYDFDVFYANSSVQDMRFTIDILKYDDISKVLNLIEKMEKVSFNRQNRTVVVNMR